MCEAFAAYQPPPNLKQARWLLDHLFARGINRIEYMYWMAGGGSGRGPTTTPTPTTSETKSGGASSRPRGGGGTRYFREPGFPAVAAYANRLSYLLGEGRPAAQIGVYIPSSSFWLGSPDQVRELNTQFLALCHQLIEHQRDFDFVDEQALSSVLRVEHGQLVNRSGQGYRAIIVPPALAISRAALDRLQAFAQAGGRVIFIGPPPASVVDRAFLHASGPADIGWATAHENEIAITPAVLSQLPPADFALEKPRALVSYSHRRLRDADVYFIFNSGDDKLATSVTLAGTGGVEVWDAENGKVRPLGDASAIGSGGVRVPLALEPWSTALLVIGGTATAASH
jgi:hypothetical protein